MRTAWIALTLVASLAIGQSSVQKPAPGSKLRKAVLDGLRPSIEKDLKQKVIFKVDEIRVYQGWAFLHVHPLQPNGKPIDFKKTKYAEDLAEGMFDGDSTYAILRQSGNKWVVKAFSIGPTDVVWIGWMDPPIKAPKKVFPPMGG